jgi:hypothetical protein
MTRMLVVPRSRGVVCGLLLVLLGLWGALIPLVGPYFHFAYTPDVGWRLTSGRIWLEIVPGAAAFLGGILLLVSRSRPVAMFGAALAAAGGAWFAVGTVLAPIWPAASALHSGLPVGSTTLILQLEHLAFFTGLGVVIVFVAALALGRLAVVGVRDVALATGREEVLPERVAADTSGPSDVTTATSSRAASGRGRLHTFGRWLVARNS